MGCWAVVRAGLVLLLVLGSGCVGIAAPARVPDELLGGRDGNGWALDAGESEQRPQGSGFGLVATQTLLYEDPGDPGYPASLSLTTIRTLLAPSTNELRERVRERVRERAQELGIRLDAEERQGSRVVATGDPSLWFLFRGTVEEAGELFTQDATVRILGEVWNCRASGNSVAAVGLAQIDSVTLVNGVPVRRQVDETNWRELVQDPAGSIEGVAGIKGLLYNVAC